MQTSHLKRFLATFLHPPDIQKLLSTLRRTSMAYTSSKASYQYDVFLSHASGDKTEYVEPLARALDQVRVSYWLDGQQSSWGDSLVSRINDGLRNSRYGIICLSQRFLDRPWPENELGTFLTSQNRDGRKRVLPLILNSTDTVLSHYPILAGFLYREYESGAESVARELAELIRGDSENNDEKLQVMQVIVESIHTGKVKSLNVSRRATLGWLIREAMNGLGIRDIADSGAPYALPIRWALVDAAVEVEWHKKTRSQQRKIIAMVAGKDGPKTTKTLQIKLGQLGVYDGMVCHLYAFEDETRLSSRGGYGGSSGGGAAGAAR
jgi:hypothetical protein